MITSEKIDQLALALNKAQAVMETAKRTSENPFYRSHYADLAEVWSVARKPLTDNGLSVIQTVDTDGENHFTATVPVKDKEGKVTGNRDVMMIWITVISRLLHISEQYVESRLVMPCEADPQSLGKVVTYLRRYALGALVGISSEDDDAQEAQERIAGMAPKRVARPSTPAGATPTETKENWCEKHQTFFFKKGNMKGFAHPVGEEGKWCSKPLPVETVERPAPPEPTDMGYQEFYATVHNEFGLIGADPICEALGVDGFPDIKAMGYSVALQKLRKLRAEKEMAEIVGEDTDEISSRS